MLLFIHIYLVYRNEVDIASVGRYRLLADGTLMIEDTKATDAGNYYCIAENDAGQARSGPAQLIVLPETNSIIGKQATVPASHPPYTDQ